MSDDEQLSAPRLEIVNTAQSRALIRVYCDFAENGEWIQYRLWYRELGPFGGKVEEEEASIWTSRESTCKRKHVYGEFRLSRLDPHSKYAVYAEYSIIASSVNVHHDSTFSEESEPQQFVAISGKQKAALVYSYWLRMHLSDGSRSFGPLIDLVAKYWPLLQLQRDQ